VEPMRKDGNMHLPLIPEKRNEEFTELINLLQQNHQSKMIQPIV